MLDTIGTPAEPSVFIEQDWAAYTDEDHQVWGMLASRIRDAILAPGSPGRIAAAADETERHTREAA